MNLAELGLAFVLGGSGEQLKTASGSIVSIPNALAKPVADLKSSIVAVQSGSGDPSPQNIRPISGWDAVKVVVNGVNQWDEQWELGTWGDASGTIVQIASTTQIRNKNLIPVLPNTSYCISTSTDTSGFFIVLIDDADTMQGSSIVRVSGSTYKTFTTGANTHYIGFSMASSYGTTYKNDISINYPSTDTSYHQYQGTTHTITLPNTCYGGEVDVTEGEVTGAWRYRVLTGANNENWGKYEAYNGFFMGMDGMKSGYRENGICNWLKTNPTGTDKGVWFGVNSPYFYVLRVSDLLEEYTVEKWREYLSTHNLEVVFPLANPTTTSITPITNIQTLEGQNNIFSDSGDTTVEYYADGGSPVKRNLLIYDALFNR